MRYVEDAARRSAGGGQGHAAPRPGRGHGRQHLGPPGGRHHRDHAVVGGLRRHAARRSGRDRPRRADDHGGKDGRSPSSEKLLHLACYRAFDDIGSVIHSHPVYATMFAIAHQDIPACIDEFAIYVGGDVRCTEYAASGTADVGEQAVKALEGQRRGPDRQPRHGRGRPRPRHGPAHHRPGRAQRPDRVGGQGPRDPASAAGQGQRPLRLRLPATCARTRCSDADPLRARRRPHRWSSPSIGPRPATPSTCTTSATWPRRGSDFRDDDDRGWRSSPACPAQFMTGADLKTYIPQITELATRDRQRARSPRSTAAGCEDGTAPCCAA